MSGQHGSALRLDILGPLRAWRGDTPVALGRTQQRVVLGVLALHANQPVGRGRLIAEVWGANAPAYAVNLLQKHISGLRRALEPDDVALSRSALLTWTGEGYRLALPPGGLDLELFDQGLTRARAARATGDLGTTLTTLHEALGLWRGPLLDGVSSAVVDAERDRLSERRMSAIEERIEIDLAVGDDRDLVVELRRLVARWPLRERLRGLLMQALYRSGQQAQALAVFRAARSYLLAELGVEPAAELQSLHRRMLSNDPSLTPTVESSTGPARAVPRPTTPAQLPHALPHFTGRQAQLGRLDDLVTADQSMVIAAITGTAGVGKTALAVHWAHRASHRFSDGQLYVNLKGFDPTASALEPGEALHGFLDALAVPAQQIPSRLEDQATLYRSLLAGRRVLVVLDNARDSEQVKPLLPGSPGCVVVVTSRSRLPGLVALGAVPVPVDRLTTNEARALLGLRIGRPRMTAEPAAVDDIVSVCDGLPLALAIVAARAAVQPRFNLAAVAGELRQAHGGLDAFVGESPFGDARAVLSWSYRALLPDVARMFRLLGLHPGTDFSVFAAASLAGVTPAAARRLLTELTGAHLVEECTPGRYASHDLLRAYAAELVVTPENAAERQAAMRRLLDHYLHTAHLADQVLYPYRDRIEVDPPRPAVTVPDIVDQGRALTWFMTECRALLGAVNLAAEEGFDTHSTRLVWTITAFLNYQGKWHDWAAGLHTALTACLRMRDRAGQALAHRLLSLAYLQQGLLDDAGHHVKQGLDMYAELSDRAGQARIHLDIGRVLERQNDLSGALDHAQLALELSRSTGDRAGEAHALNWVGWYHSRLGFHQEALHYCHRSLDLRRELGDFPTQADIWDALGYAHHHLGNHDEAMACYEQALGLWRELGDRYEVATTLLHLGDTLRAADDPDGARTLWQQARTILKDLGHPLADQLRIRLDVRPTTPTNERQDDV
ncbi:AfsR/SARP family transcriptional regulator [Micromonospora sp. LOL_024]|uniref:AfsR/SARP family transcriptional regulator n=1 Tax=Micromonospora sp. LOL_024 TaxID=3345412 RepID=UPI003A8828A2